MTARTWVLGIVTATVLVIPGAGQAMDTLSGEVIDMACYLPHPETGRGPSHRKCADTCAKKGIPIGILTDDGQVYLLLEDHESPKAYAQLKDKAAEKVSVEGEKVTRGGVQGFVVETLK
ncbi:MAG: hypothetical protein U0807_03590 [Candidatus Binatia bacterium]